MNGINKSSRLPLYYQLVDIIKEKIESNELAEHDKLPPERELCEIYDVSRATVRQAMKELEIAGYVYKSHGKGTFVMSKKIKQDLQKFYSFTTEMEKIGKKPSSQVIEFEAIECNNKIAAKMGCKLGDKLYKFKRLRLADNEPMMLETTYIPLARFQGISKAQLETQPMYTIFSEQFNVKITMAEESFVPVTIREDEALFLQAIPKSPALMVERLTYEGNTVIEYTVGIVRGDKFKYRVVLQ